MQNEADQLGADGLSCPLCQSKSEFIDICQRFGGVFIRRKVMDETNPELQVKPNECSKPKCCCPYGLSYSDDHRYRFWLCTKCHIFKIHQSCREAKDYPNYVCILCVRGKAGMSKFAVRKVGGNPSVRVDTVTSIIYPDSSGIKLEESDIKKEESEENGGRDDEEFAKRRSPRKRSSRNRPDVGFDAEFSDISSADDETAFEKEERENSRSRKHRDRDESDLPAQEKVVVEGKHEISKPIVNQFHPAIRDLTKPPKGTKFTTRRNAVGGQFMPRPPTDGQQKKEPMNLVKLDPQTILGLASSGNPANIEKAEELLQQLTSRFGGFMGNKATIALNCYNTGNQRGNQSYEENKAFNRDRGRGGDRFDYKGTWGGKHDNRGGDYRRGHFGRDHRRDDKSFHRYNQPFRQGRSGDKHRSKSREHDDRKGSRDRRYDSNRNRRYEQYANSSSPKQTTPPKEKPNLAHVPKSLVDHVVRDIEKEAAAKAEAEEKMRTDAMEAKKRIEEELRQIQEEEDAKKREKEEKKAAVAAGGWKPLGESEVVEKGSKSDEEPEEGEAEDSGEDGESSSSSSSSDSDSSSEGVDKKGSGNEETVSGEDENDENKRPDVSKLLEIEPEPEIELTEEEQLINLQRFSEQANEYKKRFRSLEDSIRKLHTDVVFYAERCDQDMIQGVQSQCNLYNLEINKLFQFCKEMKPFATAEGTKIQINTFVIKIGDAEAELKKAREVVDEFAQLIEKISILEELLVEQIKEEALIVEPIMKDLRTQPKVLLDKVRSDIESALADSTDNPKSLHRNYEQFVNKLNSMLRDGDVKLDKVASLEASVMEHQENLGKHLKELRFELNDRNNLKSYVDEIAKLLTSHKTTAEHIESTKSHPDRAMSCIQSLRKEYKRLSKATDKYRVKYSSANLELPDGMEEILYNLKETKAKLEIELEQLVTKCEGWKKEAAPLLTPALGGGLADGKTGDDSSDASKKKGFGFQLKLSDETQKVIKDGNQLLKAQSSCAEQNVVSDSSDSEEKTSGNRSDDELSTKIPDYLAPLPKPIDHNPQPIMPLPPVTTAASSNSFAFGAPTGALLPPVPPQMPNVPVPPTFQPPFMSMSVVPPPMFPQPHQMQMPPAFAPPMGQQNPMNPPPNINFQAPPGIPIQFSQMPPNPAYMPPPQQVTFSAAPSLIQAQPMHYGPNATQPHMHPIPQSPSVQAPVMSLPVSSTDNIIASDVVSSLPDSSLIEAAAKALENVAAVSSLESAPPVKTKTSSDSSKKKKKRKKNEDADSDIEAIESFPKPQSLDLSSVSINLNAPTSPESSVSDVKSTAKEAPESEVPTLPGLSRKAKKERRRKYRKGGFHDEELEETEAQVAQEVQYPQEKNSKRPSAFSYAAAMVGLNSDVLNADETYDPAEPTIVNYNHAVDTNSFEVVYRPEQADFVLVQKNSDAAAAVHAQQQQVSDALTKAAQQNDATSDAEMDEESLKKKEQIKKERKERKKAQKEAVRKERELEREEEMKQGKKGTGKSGPISSMLSILSQLDENNEQKEEKVAEKEEEVIEPITCIQINTSTSPSAKDAKTNKARPDVKLSPQVVNSTTGSLSPTQVSTTNVANGTEKTGRGNVSPFMSNKVTSSQTAFDESEILLQPTLRSQPEDGEEEEGEVNSEEESEVRSPTKGGDEKVPSPPVLQDKQVNSSVSNVPLVSFSQEEATSTIADETLFKPPGPPQLHQTPSKYAIYTSGDLHKTVTSTGAKMNGTPTGHVINFDEESDGEQSEEEKNVASASSEDEQPSLVPSKSGKSKKVTSMVPPPPPERKRNKKKDKKVAESSSTSTDDESDDESSSSSSEEEPQLTKKQLKKMMKFYAMFAKSKGSAKSKKKTKKRKKSCSVDEESSDETTSVKHKKARRLSTKKNAESSDSEDSNDFVTPKKKMKKSKSAKSTPSGGKPPTKTQPENQQSPVADDSDEISMSSFFNQDDSVVSSVIDTKTTSKSPAKQHTSPAIQSTTQLLTPETAIERFLPEFCGDNDPPISAMSRHFSSFWELFPVKTDKEAVLARQIAIGLLETAINYNQEGKTTVPIQTQMVLTMLKNMKSW